MIELNNTKGGMRSFRPSNFHNSLTRGASRRLTYYDQQVYKTFDNF